MGTRYNDLTSVETAIINNAGLSSRYVSKKNEMINKMFNKIRTVMYADNNQEFYDELNTYLELHPLDLGYISSTSFIETKYVEVINHFIRKYFCEHLFDNTFSDDSPFNRFTIEELNSIIYVKLQTDYDDDYYTTTETIAFKIYLDTPKLLSLLNARSTANIEIDEHGVIKTKLHGLISNYVISTSKYEISNVNDVLNLYKEGFVNCYNVINKIKKYFNID